jgi:uncharacterized DUF497 family protein
MGYISGMEFEWDSDKDVANRTKHNLTFAFATRVFDDPHALRVEATRAEDGERRWKAIGSIDDKLFTVVFTVRSERVRLISARRANPSEDRAYGRNQI